MVNFIVSLVLGMIPEVLYLTLFMVYAKGIKEKKLKLFILLALGYILLVMICRFVYVFYIAYLIYAYLILKWLYKCHISSIFVFIVSISYLSLTSLLCYKFISNYTIAFLINRSLLFIPFIFKDKFNIIYRKYIGLWNRTENAKIKSITLRNSSLLILNTLIISLYLIILLMLSF